MWYTEPGAVTAAIREHGSLRAAARAHGLHHSTLSKWARRTSGDTHDTNASSVPGTTTSAVGATITNDHAIIVGAVGDLDPNHLLRQHRLDPDEWEYTPTLNAWETYADGEYVTLSQLKLVCKKRVSAILLPARADGWRPSKPRTRKPSRVRHVMLLPDPHAPLHEPTLTAAALELAAQLKPADIICLGDAADNSPFKRHKANPRIDCTAQEAIDATYVWLADLRNAAPDSRIRIIPGNHDWWLLDRLKETMPQLSTLKRPGDPSPVMGMRHLLRLDELHIELEDTIGEYHDATISITDDLVAMHGTRTGQYGGAVKEFGVWEGASIVQGHDHKAAIVAMTKRLPDNTETQRYAISAGTMARRDLGYNPARNAAQAFVVITIHNDGRWHAEHAYYDPQHDDVTWRDWRYTA